MIAYPLSANQILWLGLLLLVVWVWSEYSRRRRLKRFGIVGPGIALSGWGGKIGGVILRAAGTCAAAAVLAVPFTLEDPGFPATPRMVIALDSRTLKTSPGAPRAIGEELDRAVARVLEAAPGCRWSIYALEDTSHLLVPDTPDVQGALMMFREAALAWQGTGSGLTRKSLAGLVSILSDDSRTATLVILTGNSTESIMQVPPPATATGIQFLMLQLDPRSGSMRVASARPKSWHWEQGLEVLPLLLAQARAAAVGPDEGWRRSGSTVRYLAGLALLLLGVESACGLFGHPREGRR